jgi:peptide methionine sulfoxide reductase MsrB
MKIGYKCDEAKCATGGHLGHIFNDGPSETKVKDIVSTQADWTLFQKAERHCQPHKNRRVYYNCFCVACGQAFLLQSF